MMEQRKDINRLKVVLAEKKFNRQVQLNAEARILKRELVSLQEEIDKLKQ